MKISFRIECPFCYWGHEWRDGYVNMGWIALKCNHCEQKFFTKIAIPTVKISTLKHLPENVPCSATEEAKEFTMAKYICRNCGKVVLSISVQDEQQQEGWAGVLSQHLAEHGNNVNPAFVKQYYERKVE